MLFISCYSTPSVFHEPLPGLSLRTLTHFIPSVRNPILSFNFSNFSLLSMVICCCYCRCSSSAASAVVWKSFFYSQVLFTLHTLLVLFFFLLLLLMLLLLCCCHSKCYGFERSLLTLGCFLPTLLLDVGSTCIYQKLIIEKKTY